MTEKPGTPGNILVRAYGRSTTFKTIIGDDIYNRLGFDMYEGVKKTTKIEYMVAPLELNYHEVTPKNEGIAPYNVVDSLGDMHIDLRGNGYNHDNSLRNEQITITSFSKEGLKTIHGIAMIDGIMGVVRIYPEDARFIAKAGYKVDFSKPVIDFDGDMPVILANGGKRRIAEIQDKHDSSVWHQVERKR